MDQQLFLLFVLLLGVGLGTVATAWATRRPESADRVFQVQVKDQVLTFAEDPTQEEVEALRKAWAELADNPKKDGQLTLS